jgi:hypothetical protein
VRIIKMLAVFGLVAVIGGGAPVAAETEEGQELTDLVQILKNEGVLDEGQYNELTAKAAKREAKKSWSDRISMRGDLRGRWGGLLLHQGGFGFSEPQPPSLPLPAERQGGNQPVRDGIVSPRFGW